MRMLQRFALIAFALVRPAEADEALARRVLAEKGCAGCHDIPGVAPRGADVGPPLGVTGRRVYLAGALPNDREHLIRWITHTQEVHPGDAMPSTEMTDEEAGAVADYLESLK